MEEMLQTQDEVQVCSFFVNSQDLDELNVYRQAKCEEELNGLHDHVLTLEHLRNRYISYQLAFNKLILELARRRQYREAAENIVRGMTAQLEAMTAGMYKSLFHFIIRSRIFELYLILPWFGVEEDQVRKHFNLEFGINLPEDLCLCIGNSPTQWEVTSCSEDVSEFLPAIESDLLIEVCMFEIRPFPMVDIVG